MNPLTTLPAAADQQSQPQQAAALTRAAPVPGVTGSQLRSRFAPRPVSLSWPATEAGRSEVLAKILTPPFALDHAGSQQKRRLGVLAVLNWLQALPGDTWQDRWLASGAESQPDWQHLVAAAPGPAAETGRKSQLQLSPGLLVLICADVIRPSLGWLLTSPQARRNLAVEMGRTRDTAAFAELNRMCVAATVGLQVGQQALTRIGVILAAKGGLVADVRVGDCLELLEAAADLPQTNDMHARSPLFYQLLHARGGWGEDAPAAIQVFSGRGQPSCEQLIDRYHIQCRPMRDVLVDYLRERQPSVDFSTLQHDAYLLGKLFWADLEAHSSRHRLTEAAPRRRRRLEATGDDQNPDYRHR